MSDRIGRALGHLQCGQTVSVENSRAARKRYPQTDDQTWAALHETINIRILPLDRVIPKAAKPPQYEKYVLIGSFSKHST
jgi:hypothetical protein